MTSAADRIDPHVHETWPSLPSSTAFLNCMLAVLCAWIPIPRGSSIKLWEIAERDQLIDRIAAPNLDRNSEIGGDDVVINRRRRWIYPITSTRGRWRHQRDYCITTRYKLGFLLVGWWLWMHILNYLHVGARVLVLLELVEFVISTSFLCILIYTHEKDLLLPVVCVYVCWFPLD